MISDASVIVVCATILLAITLHWYRPFRDDAGKKLIADAVDSPGDILSHLYAAGLGAASLQFKKDDSGCWQAEIAIGERKFWLAYHHGELDCNEVDGAEFRLPQAAYKICTVSQQVGMLCFEIAAKVKQKPNQVPEPTPPSVTPAAEQPPRRP